MSKRKSNARDLLAKLAAAEEDFLQREFLAPGLSGGVVRVKIGGVVCQIRITPKDFTGWGIFQPSSHTEATLVRQASLAERCSYLGLFPMIRLIVCRRAGSRWFGSAASFGDGRIRLEGLAPLQMADEVQLFDCVQTRYDGSQFWFDEIDMRHDPGTATYLRSELDTLTPPEELARKGLTAEERAAYELNYWQLVRPEQQQQSNAAQAPVVSRRRRRRDAEPPAEADLVRARLRENLSHAGAELIDYLERADSFRVSYAVEGRRYTSSVNKDDLTVQVAGICLSGEDHKFDLASMVGVLREGSDGGMIYRIGEGGLTEEQYWEIHLPTDQ